MADLPAILPEQGAAARWLRGLTGAQQSVVAGLFLAAIVLGSDTADAVLQHALQALELQGQGADAAQRPELRRIHAHLRTGGAGALAFAADRLAWSRLPEVERDGLRAASAVAFREQALERYKSRLAAFDAAAGGR